MPTHGGPKRAASAQSSPAGRLCGVRIVHERRRSINLLWVLAVCAALGAGISGYLAAHAASALGATGGPASGLPASPAVSTTTTGSTTTTTGTTSTATATATGTTATGTTTTGTTTTTTTDPTATGTTTTGTGATTTTAPATSTGTATSTSTSTSTTPRTATVPAATTTTHTATTPTTTTTTHTATTPTPTTTTTSAKVTSAKTQSAAWIQTVTVTVPASSETDSGPSTFDPLNAAVEQDDVEPLSSTLGVDSSTLAAQTALTAAVVSTDPPKALVKLYKAAGKAFDVPWQVLAAINAIETDYGHDDQTSSAGAVGLMQFEPQTFAKYALKTGTGKAASPYNATDAIFAAAHLLAANGASTNLRKAIYAYNHADWYVDEVTFVASSIVGAETTRSASVTDKIDAMQETAQVLTGFPYVWGGGHSGWTASVGYDCSGFVSAVLHAAGYLSEPQTTQTLPSAAKLQTGPGRYVTVFDRTDASSIEDDHVIIDIDGQWWESGGGSGDGGADDVHRITDISSSYLATFNLELHPAGL